MTDMLDHHRYRTRYPRSGQLAILCEGDLVGFEADLLEKWTADTAFIDVWPCGTKSALFGFSDALGRAIPLLVIEDRDFRSLEQSNQECEAKTKDRRGRAVQIVGWRTWRRNEIENYLIEPDVMIPVLSSAFELQESLVRERIDRIVEVLRVDQAAQATIADFVARLPDVAKLIPGLPRKEARPVWDAKVNAIVPGDPTVVEEKLRASLEEKLASASAKACTVSLDGLLRGFKERVEQWSDVRIESKEWLIDWSGKEVLTAAIRWLSGEFGWHMNGGKLRIDWSALNRNDAEAVEREIVTALQPRFVNRFLEHLAKRASEDVIRLEWESIRNTLH